MKEIPLDSEARVNEWWDKVSHMLKFIKCSILKKKINLFLNQFMYILLFKI